MGKAVGRIKSFLDHHTGLDKLDPLMRKLGVVHFLHILDEKVNWNRKAEDRAKFQLFFEQHFAEYQRLSDMLEDDFSRETLERVLEYRKMGRSKVLKEITVEPQYFQKDIFAPVENEVFVDGGGYTGDTVRSYMEKFTIRGGENYKRVYVWEPDATNIERLNQNLKNYRDITVLPYGMWNEKGVLGFDQDGSGWARIDQTASNKIQVDTIDNQCAEERVTFIKMDIEGSERNALKGAVNTIRRDKPRLAICIYHSPEEIYEIPFWIKATVPEYKLYMRHHCRDSAAETVIYATL